MLYAWYYFLVCKSTTRVTVIEESPGSKDREMSLIKASNTFISVTKMKQYSYGNCWI